MSATRYCVAADVQAYFTSVQFTASTALDTDKLGRLIEDSSAFMDGSLRRVYPLPITNETDLRILKGICARLVAGDVDDILNPIATNGTHKTRDLKKEGKQMLQEFCDRAALLDNPQSRITCIVADQQNKDKKEY
jgi:hypothetical protein